MNNLQDIDFVLPCYNPHKDWDKNIIDGFRLLQRTFKGRNINLYIVDDGSKRGIEEQAVERLRSAIPGVNLVGYQVNRGKGYAVRYGAGCCTSPLIIYTDYDFPYTNDSMIRVVQELDKGGDVVVAVRNARYQKNLPPLRKILSKSSHLLNRMVLGLKIKDTQGGLKGFNRKGRDVFLSTRTDSFLFDTEFVLKASRRKDITICRVDSQIKKGLHVSDMGIKVMVRELFNFFKIIFEK